MRCKSRNCSVDGMPSTYIHRCEFMYVYYTMAMAAASRSFFFPFFFTGFVMSQVEVVEFSGKKLIPASFTHIGGSNYIYSFGNFLIDFCVPADFFLFLFLLFFFGFFLKLLIFFTISSKQCSWQILSGINGICVRTKELELEKRSKRVINLNTSKLMMFQ